MSRFRIAALYKFTELADVAALRQPLLEQMQLLGIKGTILLAPEGINGTVAGTESAIDSFIGWLHDAPAWNGRLCDLDAKYSTSDTAPFARCKVKLKREIVTMGVTDIDPATDAGTYVDPMDWNALISRPDVLTIDTRNEYEVGIGKFRNSINPHTTTFRDFPAYAQNELDPARHKKVAMCCTGGIRCEKSTAYLKSLGFDEVFHLRGGILRYLEEIPPDESFWEGECFVFDERVAVDHALQPGSYVQCHACRMPLSAADLEDSRYVAGESCPNCYAVKSDVQRNRYREREKQVRLARERGEGHMGDGVEAATARRRTAKIEIKQDQRRRQPRAS